MEAIYTYIDNNADPRTNHYYGMSSPTPTIIISLFYVIGVKIIGPALMRDRKPFVLNKILIWYNVFQVVLSAYVVARLFPQILALEKFSCGIGDTSSIYAAGAIWWYFISKFTEFFDTIFFVMRKKYNQVSILHVSHHAVMPFVAYITAVLSPTGTPIIFMLANSFIHVIMYSYYLLSAMGPEYQKVLNKYKPYITLMQIVQFIYVISHCTLILMMDCPLNKIPIIIILGICLFFLIMFSMFFKKSYVSKTQSNKTK